MKNEKKKVNVRNLTLYGLFIALVYVATRFINIPGPTPGGLFHLGNVMFFTVAIVFGKKAGAISGGIGMALFDITSPYAVWAPFTFIIRFAMGYIIGVMACREIVIYEKDSKFKKKFKKIQPIVNNSIGIVLATIIMIVGYYITEIILYGNIYAPLQSVYGNFMQCVVGTILGLPLASSLKAGFKSKKIVLDI
ncbi:Uncharacterized membrane protein [Clostridium cavendishii DSM 21758]|uniref:Uncharacterized membrane protein n=1 Tax=Clostridium cavendishii DSM 21758 TaxID=1121302 RepID=A0A1M6ADI1_9CLOT|nr:ECF transporter S component [Clostridium cavendishii]SHI34471.1 Uncharacterized membrane protein [Clostridium cavendishii DSM 21758]